MLQHFLLELKAHIQKLEFPGVGLIIGCAFFLFYIFHQQVDLFQRFVKARLVIGEIDAAEFQLFGSEAGLPFIYGEKKRVVFYEKVHAALLLEFSPGGRYFIIYDLFLLAKAV